MWFCDLSQGFGIVGNFVKQPMHSSNIWLNLTDYNPKIVCGLTDLVRQRFSFVAVYLFPESCWKSSENWMKFNSMFSTSINICVKEEYIECNTSFMLLLLLLSMNYVLQCMQNQDLLQHLFYSYYALLVVPKMVSVVCTLIFSITF